MGEKFLRVYSFEEAIDKILYSFELDKGYISIPVENSFGYYLSEDICSFIDIPPFRKSLVDGFAVKSSDVKGASFDNPVFLKNLGEIKIGEKPNIFISEGSTCFVPTGGVVPEGADAVIMLEDAELKGDTVFIYKDAQSSQNIFEAGTELKRGTLVLKKGTRITEKNIGLLNSVGVNLLKVFSPIKIGLFSTGDEISDAHPLPYGKIYDFNRISLKNLITKDGFVPSDYGIISDNEHNIRHALETALKENDLVIMTGGTSKGKFDFTVEIINSLGTPGVVIHGLNVSPGKPTIFGIVDKKLVVGLSGNPLASFMIYAIVVRKILSKKLGLIISETKVLGKLTSQVSSRKGRDEFVLGRFFINNNENYVEPIFSDSSFIFSLSISNGYFRIPKEKEGLKVGELVEFSLW